MAQQSIHGNSNRGTGGACSGRRSQGRGPVAPEPLGGGDKEAFNRHGHLLRCGSLRRRRASARSWARCPACLERSAARWHLSLARRARCLAEETCPSSHARDSLSLRFTRLRSRNRAIAVRSRSRCACSRCRRFRSAAWRAIEASFERMWIGYPLLDKATDPNLQTHFKDEGS
jgi:hypothetical protein